MQRVAKLGCRIALVTAIPINGRSFGHPDYDPVWATAQDLDMAIGVHLGFYSEFGGSQWYRNQDPGYPYMYVQMCIKQEPRTALTTMVIDGVFERFPRLRVATVEAKSGWVGEWIERMDYFYQYTGKGTGMKRPASEYFARNIWIGADPDEKMLPPVVQFLGDDKFFIGSDYPHAEGYVKPIETARKSLAGALPAHSIDKILGGNAAKFYGI
jgi:predicted TIM-barrel fold metal-dependent hydrolase